MNIEILGFLAGIMTTSSFFPQAYKIWKTKNADGVSTTMYFVMLSGVCLWAIYGFLINSTSIILFNIFTLIIILMILYFKIQNKDSI